MDQVDLIMIYITPDTHQWPHSYSAPSFSKSVSGMTLVVIIAQICFKSVGFSVEIYFLADIFNIYCLIGESAN